MKTRSPAMDISIGFERSVAIVSIAKSFAGGKREFESSVFPLINGLKMIVKIGTGSLVWSIGWRLTPCLRRDGDGKQASLKSEKKLRMRYFSFLAIKVSPSR